MLPAFHWTLLSKTLEKVVYRHVHSLYTEIWLWQYKRGRPHSTYIPVTSPCWLTMILLHQLRRWESPSRTGNSRNQWNLEAIFHVRMSSDFFRWFSVVPLTGKNKKLIESNRKNPEIFSPRILLPSSIDFWSFLVGPSSAHLHLGTAFRHVCCSLWRESPTFSLYTSRLLYNLISQNWTTCIWLF
jgi:hypothetical protein